IAGAYKKGGKLLVMGNGGSAADSQHFAAELVGRFKKERKPMNAVALSTNTSILTAIGNDYGFDEVYSKQVEAMCLGGDIVVGISTSGSSVNVGRAFEAAKKLGARTVLMTGSRPGTIAGISDEILAVPSSDTPRIQEAHILIIHIICELVEEFMSGPGKEG
ncbi:MAG: phosphoheptose isomerase, partial [Lentisphaerae bacterium GWF2_52_8]